MLRVGVNIFLKAFYCRFLGTVFVNFSNYLKVSRKTNDRPTDYTYRINREG